MSTVLSSMFGSKKKTEDALPVAAESTTAAAVAPAAEAQPEGIAVMNDFTETVKKGQPFKFSTSSISAVLDLVRNKDALDDRKLFLEHALTFISRLEEGDLANTLRRKIIQLLYNDLTHPSATSVSPQFAWRAADGSANNIDMPDMGKADTPYSRSVQQMTALPKNQLPDPGLLFDTLLRREKFVEHPAGLNSLFFAFATLVIHTVFRTAHRDWNVNETSSYVDLAPLYGNNVEDQNRIRTRDGFGTLFPDVFAEDRLLMLPPAVCVLLVLFSRNHNYIAAKLLEINERGKYVDPATLSLDDPAQKAQLLAQEEDIFQTARLVNCGWFGTVVFSDYFSCILGLVRDGNTWSLTPFEEMRMDDHSLFERGKGNVCSVEFNCLYRWHATTSQEDEAWTKGIFDRIFPGKPHEQVTSMDFRTTARKMSENRAPTTEWVFGGLKRQGDGSFRDEDLAKTLMDASEHPAAAFGARGTPGVMKFMEVMGIEQSRKWGVCSLNEFRRYLGLKPYSTFLEWNSDVDVARTAELLYGNIEKLELYVGLQAEESKPLVDGAGLCPGYTISRAILSDAIALTRGDRFFTHDFTPFNLTAWGFQDCQRDAGAFGFGSTLGRLFLRTMPHDFNENSVYTFFPLMLPKVMKGHLKRLNNTQYDLARPVRRAETTIVRDYASVAAILKEPLAFRAPYAEKARKVIKGKGFYPAESVKEQDAVRKALSGSPALVKKIGQYFYDQSQRIMQKDSYTFVGGKQRGIDVVGKLVNTISPVWLADLCGVSVRGPECPEAPFNAKELSDALNEIYSFIFLNVEASKVMVLQEKVKKHVALLHPDIQDNITGILTLTGIFNSFVRYKKPIHFEAIQRLAELEAYKDVDVFTNAQLALMVVANAEITMAATNMIDLYLGSDQAAAVHTAAVAKDTAALKGFVHDALHAAPPFAGAYRVSTRQQAVQGRKYAEGERVFVDIHAANSATKGEASVNVLRAEGAFEYLGEELTTEILARILQAVFERKGLTRAPGFSGNLQRFRDDSRPECHYAYLNHGQNICEWPSSLSVLFST